MDSIWEKFKMIAENSEGFITTGQVEQAGVSRPMIKKYVDSGQLQRIRKGLYVLKDSFPDELAVYQARSSKIVYSYGTALFLWGMTDRVPHVIDMTAPHGHNLSRIFGAEQNVRFHYVQKSFYPIGITETKTPQGSTVQLYDRERCICDLIRDKTQMDMQLYTQAIQDYFKNKPNCRRLIKYGKQFGVEETIRTYMEVLS